MRQIKLNSILTFSLILIVAIVLGIMTAMHILITYPLGDCMGVALVSLAIIFIYLYSFGIYRAFLYFLPLCEGDISEGSGAEYITNVYFLFYLVLYNTLVRTHFIPIPIMRLVYLILGARLGSNTYSAGAILDPPLTHLGDDCIVGHDAVLFAHALEGPRLALSAIRIGNRVTIGTKAVIMSGVIIGDDAIVGAGAVVLEGTRIGPGEMWGGVPARKITLRSNFAHGKTGQ